MKRIIKNKERQRIAMALSAVFLIIVLANWWVSYSMTQVSSQFESVYQDRLVPALDIAAMQERYYQNRMLLEEHLKTDEQSQQKRLEERLRQHALEIDSLSAKYEATYLTNQEAKDLQEYKEAVSYLTKVQQQAIELSREGNKAAAATLYKAEVVPAFNELLMPMHALSKLQQDVGHELYASAEQQLLSLKMLSYLVIGLAVILAVLVGVLLQHNRKVVKIKPQQFHLN
jgi:hypothetical protein